MCDSSLRTSETINELAAALVKFQAGLVPVSKDATNPLLHNRYASLASVWDTIRAPLGEAGLSVIQAVIGNSDRVQIGVLTRVLHVSGQWMETEVTLPIGDIGKGRNLAQEAGSSITYLRRYSLMAVLGLVSADDDDDGAGSTAAKNPPPKRRTRKAPAKKAPAKKPAAGNGSDPGKGAGDEGKAYWEGLTDTERGVYRSYGNLVPTLLKHPHYNHENHVQGTIVKLFPKLMENGLPTSATRDHGVARVNILRTAWAYGDLREADMDGDRAAVEAFTTGRNIKVN